LILRRQSNDIRHRSIASVGGGEKSLFALDGAEMPRLSPDARQFAFNITRDGIINVATVPVTDGEPKQLTYEKKWLVCRAGRRMDSCSRWKSNAETILILRSFRVKAGHRPS